MSFSESESFSSPSRSPSRSHLASMGSLGHGHSLGDEPPTPGRLAAAGAIITFGELPYDLLAADAMVKLQDPMEEEYQENDDKIDFFSMVPGGDVDSVGAESQFS